MNKWINQKDDIKSINKQKWMKYHKYIKWTWIKLITKYHKINNLGIKFKKIICKLLFSK